jgi:hypothetical protein
VREGEFSGPLRCLPDHDGAERTIQQVEQVVFGLVGDASEEAEFEVAADNGGHAQDFFGLRSEPGDTASDDFSEAGRQCGGVAEVGFGDPAAVALGDGAGLGEVPQDLPCEERIAIGLPMKRVCERDAGLFQPMPGSCFQQGHDFAVAESTQIDALRVLLSMQDREYIDEWMLGRKVGCAVGADDQQSPRVRRGDQMPQQQQ